jgi:hypothetical protein
MRRAAVMLSIGRLVFVVALAIVAPAGAVRLPYPADRGFEERLAMASQWKSASALVFPNSYDGSMIPDNHAKRSCKAALLRAGLPDMRAYVVGSPERSSKSPGWGVSPARGRLPPTRVAPRGRGRAETPT